MLDPGCGTGFEAGLVAQLASRLLAVDNHAPFVDDLTREVHALGFADWVEARVDTCTSSISRPVRSMSSGAKGHRHRGFRDRLA